MRRRTAAWAIFNAKCPQCREGDMFLHKPYDLPRFGQMPEKCPNCGLHYEREPGFYYGAMYVSYALSVGIFLSVVFVLYFLFDDPPLSAYLISVAVASLLLYPLNLRYARVLFLNIFGGVSYKPPKL